MCFSAEAGSVMIDFSEMRPDLKELEDSIDVLERLQARHFSPRIQEDLEVMRRKLILWKLTRVQREGREEKREGF
jgi:hypothetical protein